MSRRASKLVTLPEAVAWVEPGMSVAFGGAVHAGRPAAFVRELVRQGPGELVLHPSPGAGWDTDLLIAAGRVGKTVIPMVTMAELGLAPSFRAAVESGELEAAYLDAMSRVAAYLASAYRHPFHFIAGLDGTDIVDDSEFFDVVTDSAGAEHRVVRALTPDICVLHVEEADEYGNARHARGRVLDVIAARASRRTIVQAERIVSNEEVRREPQRTTVPAHHVHAVVEAPFGAHPTATAEYVADTEHLAGYVRAAEARRRGDPGPFAAYLEAFVTGPCDERSYYEAVGGSATEQRLRKEADGGHG